MSDFGIVLVLLYINGDQVEPVEEFCYFGSTLTTNAAKNCEQELLKQT